ncbi:hypothetical protein GCM10023205_23940 [Yinghuangia aomiensis]|uniref:Uncharacterized protein n=1 Tax=Yinghuangia aomiensis TaxID=676205 RepID=A0ABP9H346_9ACTN
MPSTALMNATAAVMSATGNAADRPWADMATSCAGPGGPGPRNGTDKFTDAGPAPVRARRRPDCGTRPQLLMVYQISSGDGPAAHGDTGHRACGRHRPGQLGNWSGGMSLIVALPPAIV